MGVFTVVGLVVGAGLSILGLCLEIAGVRRLAGDIFLDDDKIEEINNFPIEGTSTMIADGSKPPRPLATVDGMENFKQLLIKHQKGVRYEAQRGFTILKIGLAFQIVGVAILVEVQFF